MPEAAIYQRSPQVVAAVVNETSFLLHVDDWVYLELNDSGRSIWELLDGRSVDDIVDSLTGEFNVERALGLSDTTEFLHYLEAKHFVTSA